MVQGPRRGGRHLPAKIGDYVHLDHFAAVLSLELVTQLKTRYSSFSDFLRDRMADPDAPSCIVGDPAERLTFDNAKRAVSKRLGRTATEIAEWELVEFLVRHCGPQDTDECRALRTRLAGFWLASQRYPPPGYRGPVDLPDGAPRPYADADEAPTDKIRVIMLRDQLSQERDNSQRRADEAVSELREAHEHSWAFYERENAELRSDLEHRKECERVAIKIIATLDAQRDEGRSDLERRLQGDAIHLRRQLEEVTERLNREQAAHNLTATRFAFVAACLDAVGPDPLDWLRTADFPLAADLYALLNHPAAAPARAPARRFLTVLLRTYLLSWFGDAPDRDDTVGPYRDLVRNGVLPPADVLHNVLSSHTIVLQVLQPLLEELDAEGPSLTSVPELPTGSTAAQPLDVPDSEHQTGAVDTQIDLTDLIQRLVRRPPDQG